MRISNRTLDKIFHRVAAGAGISYLGLVGAIFIDPEVKKTDIFNIVGGLTTMTLVLGAAGTDMILKSRGIYPGTRPE